jgi:hypothetical protein
MSSTNPKTLADLQEDFIGRIRAASGVTATETIATRFLNLALQDMHISQLNRFPWAERRGTLITRAPYTTGTVSLTTATSRTAMTGASTDWTTVDSYGIANVRAGGKIKVGNNEIYEVSAVAGATSLTLATQYTGSDLDGSSYTYFEDEYGLATDFARFVDLRTFSQDHAIPLIGRREFRQMYPRNDIPGKPRVATYWMRPYSGSTAARHTVTFHMPPDDAYSIPYWYVTNYLAVSTAGVEQERLSASTDEPIVPHQYRHAIIFHALYHYYRDYKDDVRSQEAKGEYVDLVTRICGDNIQGDSRPQFFVRRGGARWVKQRYDSGTRFDQLRDR